MTLDDLEAAVWQAFTEARNCRAEGKCEHCNRLADKILAAARAHGKALVRASREPKAPAAQKPPVVHFASAKRRSACRPHDPPAFGWKTASAPGDVTCGHCRKTPAWGDAAVAEAPEDSMPGGAR